MTEVKTQMNLDIFRVLVADEYGKKLVFHNTEPKFTKVDGRSVKKYKNLIVKAVQSYKNVIRECKDNMFKRIGFYFENYNAEFVLGCLNEHGREELNKFSTEYMLKINKALEEANKVINQYAPYIISYLCDSREFYEFMGVNQIYYNSVKR